jgi:hypothetical protein
MVFSFDMVGMVFLATAKSRASAASKNKDLHLAQKREEIITRYKKTSSFI